MSGKNKRTDNYPPFSGICCYVNADRLLSLLDENLSCANGEQRWQIYFARKRARHKEVQHNNLHFIAKQSNALCEYFTSCNDEEAKSLLGKIKQECC